MENSRLTRELIAQPHLWELILGVSEQQLDIGIFPPVDNEPPIFAKIGLPTDTSDYLKTLQDSIYDNPLLLSDFKRVKCLISSKDFLFIPNIEDEKSQEILFQSSFADCDDFMAETLKEGNEKMLFGINSDITAFLKRTYFNMQISHRLIPLINYFRSLSAEDGTSTWIYKHEKETDIIIFKGKKLIFSNTFVTNSPTDILYYLAAIKKEYSPEDSKFYFGDENKDLTQTYTDLKRYIPELSLIYPPARLMKAGRVITEIPLSLTAAYICE